MRWNVVPQNATWYYAVRTVPAASQTQTLSSPAAAWYSFYLYHKNLHRMQIFMIKIWNLPSCRRRIGPFIQMNTCFGTDRVPPVRKSNHSAEANAGSSHECRERVLQNGMLHGALNAIALITSPPGSGLYLEYRQYSPQAPHFTPEQTTASHLPNNSAGFTAAVCRLTYLTIFRLRNTNRNCQ